MAGQHPKIEIDAIVSCIERFRVERPHVHCLTNSVAQNFTANVLLAAGATASMTIAKEEIVAFVSMADALLINIGTMDQERSASARMAIDAANNQQKPWALDPVFVQGSKMRLELAASMLAQKPTLVRCNASEAKALFGSSSADEIDAIASKRPDLCVAQTGKSDNVIMGNRRCTIKNGHWLMDRITAMGCALNALMVGFCAVEDDPLTASASALVLYGVAGELAGESADGPGTFAPLFLDALTNVSTVEIKQRANLS